MFSMLALLLDHKPLLPASGISYADGLKVLESFLWLVSLGPRLGASDGSGPPAMTQAVLNASPFLGAVQRFIVMLQSNAHNESQPSVQRVWDSDPPFSQLAVCYRAMAHIDNLVDLVLRLVKPPCGTLPYIEVVGGDTDFRIPIPAITPFYTADASPNDTLSLTRRSDDNILSTIAIWDRAGRSY
jgi:hypothetical protein